MQGAKFKFDTREFNKTLERYRKLSKRDEVEIVNTKAYFIARRAVVETVKADKGKIKAFFNGQTQKVIGMIINKRRAERGEKGLYGEAMAEAQAAMKARRLRAVGFIKSGWIWCIKNLEPYVKQRKSIPRGAPTFGKPKGKAKPAKKSSFTVKAIIENFAQSKQSTTPDPLDKFGMPGLKKAFDFEAASMEAYIEKKLKQSAHEAGIKTH